ncbi:hypothetical protein BD413DRAFT_671307 [Trametes elegans]|nr:hypothetical protein BD413DRAFT_671307 [Trametes elegans]
MILAPSSSPPAAKSSANDRPKSVSPLKDSSSHNIPTSPPLSTCQKPQTCEKAQDVFEKSDFFNRLRVPTVLLDAPSVSHTMAAALSLSLLGHTLFLKNQVPFPVAQLVRMPRGGSNPKVARKREELLATFDTLSSHLQTTFVALSTAYAKCQSAKCKVTTAPADENSHKETRAAAATSPTQGTAHLMFVLGSSVGAARARILLTIDGLDVKVWGERADAPPIQPTGESDDEGSIDLQSSEEDEEDVETDEDDEDDEDYESAEEVNDQDSSDADEDEEEEDELDELESDVESVSASPPPASRSPSPSPSTRSLAPSPESLPATHSAHNSPSMSKHTSPAPPSHSTAQPLAPTLLPLATSAPASRRTSPVPPPAPTHAEEQATLRAAERLLSRTLMTAWADGGGDMASELAPTQTHVYLRAPRRFAHPAWLARQNLSRTLDGVLDGFLADAGAVSAKPGAKKSSRGIKTEGAWISCRGGSAFASEQARKAAAGENVDELREGDEEDEEIWWAWDGKIVGFADW